jgi:hypothetical protein
VIYQTSLLLNVNSKLKKENTLKYKMPKSFKWNENSSVLFQESLATAKMQTKIENFNKKDYLNNTDKMVDDLNNIYYEAAFTSLQKKK